MLLSKRYEADSGRYQLRRHHISLGEKPDKAHLRTIFWVNKDNSGNDTPAVRKCFPISNVWSGRAAKPLTVASNPDRLVACAKRAALMAAAAQRLLFGGFNFVAAVS